MAENIKGLITKIQQEGIEVAQDKAREIASQAETEAKAVINQAKAQAEVMVDQAKAEIARTQKSADASLKQAGRDLLLSLRKEIGLMLKGLILKQVQDSLDASELKDILNKLIKQASAGEKDEVVVSLAERDLAKIEKGLIAKLSAEVKKKVKLVPSGEISGGFIISYDSGKSHFDFSDTAIAEYLSLHLTSKLGQVLQEGTSETGKSKKSN